MSSIFDKLKSIVDRYREIEADMARPEIAVDYEQIQTLAKERASLENLVQISQKHTRLTQEQTDLKAVIDEGGDQELVQMAREELSAAETSLEELGESLRLALLPKDPNDERDVIVEIRSGTGGSEASIFAGDLYRLYSRYAQMRGWQVEVMDSNPSEQGGYNKIVFDIVGKGAFSHLKFERGVHRVQRVPDTETQGRIHTSTATVAVLPQVDDVELELNMSELRIDVYHAGGHGGQNVNKVATAIRIVHEPTGTTVVCQDERSQFKNKTKAMNMMRAKLYEAEQQRQDAEISENRRAQVGSAERSEKIRTYNYPQDRITDHRINSSFHPVQKIMDGIGLDEIIEALTSWEQGQLLEEVTA